MSIISDRLLAGPASAAVSYDDIVSSTSPSSSASSSSPLPSIDGVQQAFDAPSLSFPSPDLDLDVGGALDSALGFVSENPVAVIGGIFAIGLPLLISRLLFSQGSDKPYAVLSAKDAFKRLGPSSADSDSEGDGFLLDIRPAADVKIEGVPDLRSIKKRAIQIPYTQDGDDAVFLKKLLVKFKQPSSTTLYILDQ
jgi:chitinase domain-containing protein 1